MSSDDRGALNDTPLRVLVVDPEDIVVWGFKSLLFEEPWIEEVVGVGDTASAVGLLAEFLPDLMLVEVEVAGDPSSRLVDRIRASSPSTRLLLTAAAPVLNGYARAMGADGVIPKTWSAEAIAAAIRTAGLGMSVFEVEAEKASLLTERETSILMLISAGATNRDAAEHLSLSAHTVKGHVRSLYRKLGVRNRAGAVARATQLGLLP